VPYQYTSVPGSGRDVALFGFNQLQQVAIVGNTVGLAAQNVSAVFGQQQIGWGPQDRTTGSSSVPVETPLLAQYLFRQLPGEDTQLIGASSVKHFFDSSHSDFQHLNPGEMDTYPSSLNGVQSLYTYGSEMDPVTGELHSPIDFGHLDNNGIIIGDNRQFDNRIQYLLQVDVADLDPAQNPEATRWFLAGNLWVAGDQDVTNNSRWVEITPARNPTTGNFTFTYPNGSTGQYNFRTIPGLPGAPVVVSTTLTGTLRAPVSDGLVVFNTAIDPTTFTPDQFHLTDPNGSAVNVTGITAVDDTNTQFDVTFDPQSTPGVYSLSIGPGITDTHGNPMDAPYMGQFTITVTSSLLINGDFETGDFTGWTQGGDTSFTSVTMDNPHSGMWAAHLGPLGPTEGTLTQSFPTTAGTTYTLDYWLSNDGGSPNSFRALIDGTTIDGSVLTNAGGFAYREFTFTFTATGASTALQFAFVQNPAYWNLDDVSVTPSPGPGAAGGAAGHQAFVSATLAPAYAPAVGGAVPLNRTLGSSGGASRLTYEKGDTSAVLALQASAGGLPAPFSAAYAFAGPSAAQRPAPRGTEALDGLFAKLGEETTEV
jgi:hypothetical protein